MMIKRVFCFAALAAIFFASGLSAAEPAAESAAEPAANPASHPAERSAWNPSWRIGMFLHFLPGGDGAAKAQETFDVEKLADQIASTRVDYFVLTIYQNSGWFNAPNAEYDRVTGYKSGERCSERDIPLLMADALAKRGVALFLYVTGQVPNRDERAQKAFGLATGPDDQKLSVEFAQKWSAVFREWSLRYGDKVAGWWVDGCYEWCDFNEEIAAIYRDALKAGNPNAVVAFNPGVKRAEWTTSDYTAGEINEPFAEIDLAPETNGQKTQILTYLGERWGMPGSRFTYREWSRWLEKAIPSGAALTFDTGLIPDGETPGVFSDEALAHLRSMVFTVFTLSNGLVPQNPYCKSSCDVLVVGGGSAGTVAAIQAARAGCSTILLEAASRLGGNATSGGVNYPGLFHAWGKQVIAGIGWEWVTKTVELDGGTLPDFTKPTGPRHWDHQITVNAPLYALIAEELCSTSGVDLRFFESPESVKLKPYESSDANAPRWYIVTSALGEQRGIACKVLIDATGNGTLSAMAGTERLYDIEAQPGTFHYQIKHDIDLKTADREKIELLYAAALADGRVLPGDARQGIMNWLGDSAANYVYDADNSTALGRNQTNREGRMAILRMLRFVRTLPGGETARLVSMADEVGVRETYRVKTAHVITEEEYTSGKTAPDALCSAFYPIDLHRNATGVSPRPLAEGVVASVPLGAMIPVSREGNVIPNLLVVGRCIGSDRGANSALRVQATCMATGQAAGAVAAIASQTGTEPAAVDLAKVKELLTQHGAMIPEENK